MPLYLGLDGGGTGCRAVVADEKRPLGRGEAGAANPRAVGEARVWRHIHAAVDQALKQAGLGAEVKPSLHACLGLAGVGRPLEHRAFLAAPHPFASLRLETDVHVALVGALGGETGALLAVGTGSIIYGLDAQGASTGIRPTRVGLVQRYRVGGWGFPVGDEGGGAWLGLGAARATLYATDGRGPKSALTEAVLGRYGGPAGLLEWLRRATPKDFAELAPFVLSAKGESAEEDAVAARLRREAVGHLAALMEAFDRLYPSGPVAFSVVGSVAKVLLPEVLGAAPARFREGYREALEPPELGALRLARARAQDGRP